METGSPEWIQNSLEKLENLEQERDQHETALESASDADSLREHSEAIERLDEEIRSLYAALEAVASEEEGEDSSSEEEESEVLQTNEFKRDEPEIPAPAPEPAANPLSSNPLSGNPLSSPPPSANPLSAAPIRAPQEEAAVPAFVASSMSDAHDLDAPKGGAMKWVIIVLILVGGGVAAAMTMGKKEQVAVPAAPAGPPKVIKAGAIPEDTEAPPAAKGADVDRTPETDFSKAKSRPKRGGGSRGKGGSSKGSRPAKKNSNGRDIDLKLSDDPLG